MAQRGWQSQKSWLAAEKSAELRSAWTAGRPHTSIRKNSRQLLLTAEC
jgi:hypothetical protein